jgi:hypothetical protein
MPRSIKIALLILFVNSFVIVPAHAQDAIISGFVTDTTGTPVEGVNILIAGTAKGTSTDRSGTYSLDVKRDGSTVEIAFSHVGFRSEERRVQCDRSLIRLDVKMSEQPGTVGEVTVRPERRASDITMAMLPVKELELIPSISGSVESILKTMPGVVSKNELSSQYSVRGGNFDENLVYVNDAEIFRPFLIRSGQQEGLSVINPDLVSSVRFSSGGFGASYGDRMSSVLDIKYRTPSRTINSVSAGLLTSSAHTEGISKDRKFTWLSGVRYKSSRLMLKTLDSRGDYQPVFFDIQSLFTLKTGRKSVLSLLATWSSNTYNFIPQSRLSSFGNETEAYQLYVLFEGREKDRYQTWNTTLSWEIIRPSGDSHKFLLSSFATTERESFDIRGYYGLSNLDKEAGSENLSDSLLNIGTGSFLSHARNRLTSFIQSAGYRGEKNFGRYNIRWGAGLRNDRFRDNLREWTRIDSAGFSVPYNSSSLQMSRLISADHRVINWQAHAYLETSSKIFAGNKPLDFSAGIRGLYNSFSGELLASPRLSVKMNAGRKTTIWLAAGAYFQPPFYREMRFPDGSLNRNISSQKSVHTVAGLRYDFLAWERPFSLTAEAYNKLLWSVVPYRLENVRLIYTGENSALGYSRGIDIRLNGEFVPDAESWISLSVMESRLEIPTQLQNDFPSPSDQAFSANIFFQDYLPGNPAWRAHVNISFSTGIPIVSPYNNRFDQYHRLPAYRRVDLGITRVIKSHNGKNPENVRFSRFEEIVAGLDVFNLLDINNTVSYLWIMTVNNLSGRSRHFAIPDYLTGRSLNFRLSAKF